MEFAGEWCKIAVDDVGKLHDELGYNGVLFWETTDYGPFPAAAKRLDDFSCLHIDLPSAAEEDAADNADQ